MPDGRVAFIDFGMTKRVSRDDIEAEVGALRAMMDGDAPELHRRLASMGFFDPADEQVDPGGRLRPLPRRDRAGTARTAR